MSKRSSIGSISRVWKSWSHLAPISGRVWRYLKPCCLVLCDGMRHDFLSQPLEELQWQSSPNPLCNCELEPDFETITTWRHVEAKDLSSKIDCVRRRRRRRSLDLDWDIRWKYFSKTDLELSQFLKADWFLGHSHAQHQYLQVDLPFPSEWSTSKPFSISTHAIEQSYPSILQAVPTSQFVSHFILMYCFNKP